MSDRLELQEAAATALEAENRALRAEERVGECEAALEELRRRFEQLLRRAESQEAELAEVHHEAIAANARCETLAAELRRRDAGAADRDSTAAIQNGGCMAYLGLRVSTSRDDRTGESRSDGVVVDEVRSAAARAGIRPGDRLKSVRAVAEWPIRVVDDYRQCAVDLPLRSDVVVVVERGGEAREFAMRPEILALPDADTEAVSATRQHGPSVDASSRQRSASTHY